MPAGLRGAAHRPSREEVLLVLDGRLHVTIDGARRALDPGDMALVPVHAEMRVDGGTEDATPG